MGGDGRREVREVGKGCEDTDTGTGGTKADIVSRRADGWEVETSRRKLNAVHPGIINLPNYHFLSQSAPVKYDAVPLYLVFCKNLLGVLPHNFIFN